MSNSDALSMADYTVVGLFGALIVVSLLGIIVRIFLPREEDKNEMKWAWLSLSTLTCILLSVIWHPIMFTDWLLRTYQLLPFISLLVLGMLAVGLQAYVLNSCFMAPPSQQTGEVPVTNG